MPLTINCPRCDVPITAHDENDLVQKVQTHVREDHGLAHTLSRKHILARLHKFTQDT
jgi:predicted small metal-binding protein